MNGDILVMDIVCIRIRNSHAFVCVGVGIYCLSTFIFNINRRRIGVNLKEEHLIENCVGVTLCVGGVELVKGVGEDEYICTGVAYRTTVVGCII